MRNVIPWHICPSLGAILKVTDLYSTHDNLKQDQSDIESVCIHLVHGRSGKLRSALCQNLDDNTVTCKLCGHSFSAKIYDDDYVQMTCARLTEVLCLVECPAKMTYLAPYDVAKIRELKDQVARFMHQYKYMSRIIGKSHNMNIENKEFSHNILTEIGDSPYDTNYRSACRPVICTIKDLNLVANSFITILDQFIYIISQTVSREILREFLCIKTGMYDFLELYTLKDAKCITKTASVLKLANDRKYECTRTTNCAMIVPKNTMNINGSTVGFKNVTIKL